MSQYLSDINYVWLAHQMTWQRRPWHQCQRPRRYHRRRGLPAEYNRSRPDSAARIQYHWWQRPNRRCCSRSSASSRHTKHQHIEPEWSTWWPLCRRESWRPSTWFWFLRLMSVRSSSHSFHCGIHTVAKPCEQIHLKWRGHFLEKNAFLWTKSKNILLKHTSEGNHTQDKKVKGQKHVYVFFWKYLKKQNFIHSKLTWISAMMRNNKKKTLTLKTI